ncbi:MAG: helix-turn-helix transcriptional regulator [Planctomycetota bacterium]|nr:helix-turn-helix transcriptional regulator [Planctomycetota bacterium]
MAKSELKNRIRRLRFDHDEITQQELANRVKVTRQTIIALEANKYAPSLPLAFRIARVFGVPVEEVFQYDEQESGQVARNKESKPVSGSSSPLIDVSDSQEGSSS